MATAAQALAALTGPGVRATLYTRAQLARLRDTFEPLNRRAEAAVAAASGRPIRIAPVALAAPAIPRDEIDVPRLMAMLAGGPSA